MRYTAEQIAFLAASYPVLTLAELTEAFNDRFRLSLPDRKIRAALRNHRIRCNRPVGFPKGAFRLVTPEQADWIKDHYMTRSCRELTAAFNREFRATLTFRQMNSFVHNHGIDSGRTGCFERGHQPWNTGTKGLCKPNSGSFQKGHVPVNKQTPIGHERICPKNGYILVKVPGRNPYTGADGHYRSKHHVVYEAEFGPIPEGHVVAFRDGDKLNCSPENLVLLTKGENGYLNRWVPGYSEMDPDSRETARAMTRLLLRAKQIEREGVAA